MKINRRMGSLAALVLAMTLSQTASAVVGSATGVPQYVYTYGDGRVLVTGFTFTNTTCSNNGGFWIDGSHPYLQRIMALVLTAKATGRQLQVTAKTDNCWYPEITTDTYSYVIEFP
jgi:hypothetical protein